MVKDVGAQVTGSSAAKAVKTFLEYASARHVTDILIKERTKWIGKGTDPEAVERMHSNPVYSELCQYLPSRRHWVTPGQKDRSKLPNERTRLLKDASLAIRRTIRRDRDMAAPPAYLGRLDGFVADIRKAISSGELGLKAPVTTAVLKKRGRETPERLEVVFRPISVYTDLRTKVIVKLAYDYLTAQLDPLFHEEILSYRKRRDYHGEHPRRKYMTKAGDAIANIRRFREGHAEAWVAECDIKKFYDIVNHDRVLEALDRLIGEGGLDRSKLAPAVEVLSTYMDGYNFRDSVLAESRKEGFWNPYVEGLSRKMRLRKGQRMDCRFEWVSEEEFFSKGGYSPETWEEDCRKIGIPQGGVFSTLICNILMNDVDRAVVDPSDHDRLFNRFGDDIILMHADGQRCRALFEAYKASLTAHQLVYHDERCIGEEPYKKGAFLTPAYWDEKTKAPFRWGPGEGNCADWIGFVGYEVRSNGEVRLRKSTLLKQFDKICFRYNKTVKGITEVATTVPACLRDFDKVSWTILKFEQLDFNPSSRRQMHDLDRYRHRKRDKAHRYLESLPVKARDDRDGREKRESRRPVRNPVSYAAVLAKTREKKDKR